MINSTEIVYLVQHLNKGDAIYDKNSRILGYFTGYNTRSGVNSYGSVNLRKASGELCWVSGKAVFITGIGVKFVDSYKICR